MKFKVWKSIQIDKKPSIEGINISSYVQSILDKIKWNKKDTVDLVKLQVKDLDIKTDYPTTAQIYQKAKELGLDLCPPHVGLQLRVDYKDQPYGEYLYIGMKPIADPGGDPYVFELVHVDDGLWLNDGLAYPTVQWYPGAEFVFRLNKSNTLKLKPLKKVKPLDTSDTLNLQISKEDYELIIAILRTNIVGNIIAKRIKLTD